MKIDFDDDTVFFLVSALGSFRKKKFSKLLFNVFFFHFVEIL